ncbi:MAG TPA: NAD-dependent epimerase/dehydratase family protein [Solirubrobacterales bacterium]
MAKSSSQPAAPKRVFITGALGLIGRRLAERYREEGAEVSGVDVRAEPELGVVAGDLTARGEWERAAEGAELVIHTAARLGMEIDPDGFWRVNVVGTRNALDAAARAGARRFVQLSSIVAFGFDVPREVDERHPVRPNGVPYVDTKVASEQVVLQTHGAQELGCTIIRPGDVYGPGSHFWTLTPVRELARRRLLLPAMGRGMVSPVYVDDLVEGIMLAATEERGVGEVFTLSGGHDVSAKEFFGHYARMLGRNGVPAAPTPVVAAIAGALYHAGRLRGSAPEVTPAAVRYLSRSGTYSIEKARTVLGYSPSVDLEEGMRRCEEWLRAEGALGPA